MDKGAPVKMSQVPVRVYVADPNESVPVFSKQIYSYFIPEDQNLGSIVATITATSTHQIRYKIVSGKLPENNYPEKFIIDATGRLSLIGQLDRETVDSYLLTVVAETETTPSLVGHTMVSVKISKDINDNAPKFQLKSYQADICESVDVGFKVMTIEAVDKDIGKNGKVVYKISRNDAQVTSSFHLDEDTGLLTTVVSLDREKTGKVLFFHQFLSS